jgi:hypothetical protein
MRRREFLGAFTAPLVLHPISTAQTAASPGPRSKGGSSKG